MKLLFQTQLSSYNLSGKFDLATDSGWQMICGRCRVMLALDPELEIVVTCPDLEQCIVSPYELNADLFDMYGKRLRLMHHRIVPNALATRFDFDYLRIKKYIDDDDKRRQKRFDVVYINDPMHLRNFKCVFNDLKYRPTFVTHSHFVDVPSSPKFPQEASLWYGQIEAALRSDLSFWQCESALKQFEIEAKLELQHDRVEAIMKKSHVYDDGYSSGEINSSIDLSKIRFNVDNVTKEFRDKVVLFVPNRIGDGVRSSDYTGCGNFMRNILPELRKLRDDFVVVCGNPNQKISNEELEATSGQHGYVNVLKGVKGSGSFNRDEYKWIVNNTEIIVALYREDTYGGTSSRECIDLGCFPLWVDNFEYATISQQAKWPVNFIIKRDFSNVLQTTNELIDAVKNDNERMIVHCQNLQKVVRERCSYEMTTRKVMSYIQDRVDQVRNSHR